MRLTNDNYEDDVLSLKNKTQAKYNEDLWQYAKAREDLEEELAIDLITLLKVLSQGIYYLDGSYSDDDRLYITNDYIYNYARDKWVAIKDYKKTWFLSKEELDLS